MTNEKQYYFRVYEDGKQIDGRDIDDPFLTCVVGFRLGRWDALKAIFRPLSKRFNVVVGGTGAAHRVVFGSEYVEPEPVEKSIDGGYGYFAVVQGNRNPKV